MQTIGELLAARLAESQQDVLKAEVYRRLNQESEEYASTCERLSNEIKTIEQDQDYTQHLNDEAAKGAAAAESAVETAKQETSAAEQVRHDLQAQLDTLQQQMASLAEAHETILAARTAAKR